jgi:hypothetical protein
MQCEARHALATLVVQQICCVGGEHCFTCMRVRALVTFLLLQLLCLNPTDSQGNVTVADNDGMHMFKDYRAH